MAPAASLSERDLFEIWRGQRFPEGALVTREGVPLRVVSAGRMGRGPGPDFRNAAIAAPSGAVVRGDVELHVRTSLFRAHGHAVDPAYANVILHVVFEDDDARDTLLPGGRTAPVVALAGWVARRADDLRRWLERPLLWREPCHDAAARLGAEGVAAALEAEGDRRFGEAVERWAGRLEVEGLEQGLYRGLLEGLGYGGNREVMSELAGLLGWRRLRARAAAGDPDGATALLLGAGGLLPSQRGRPCADRAVERMERVFAASGLTPRRLAWKTLGVRPQNHPVRRLAGAAGLLARLTSPSELLGVVEMRPGEAIASLAVPARGYWVDHHDVGAAPCNLSPALLGRSRAIELLVNVILPAAAARGGVRAARRMFEAMPRPGAYGRTRGLEEGLRAQGDGRMAIDARRAQGLLGLHSEWCSRDGCGRCPLS